jgi:hypothetical protein
MNSEEFRLNRDFKEMLQVFNRHRVRHPVVGAYAVMRDSEPRYTRDFDIWVDTAAGNAARLFAALTEFGAPLQRHSPEDLADRYMIIRNKRASGRPQDLIDLESLTG